MGEGRRFKVSLLISCGVHLGFILFLPQLRFAPPPTEPEYLEVALIRPTPIRVKSVARKVTPKKPTETSQAKPKKVEPKPAKVEVKAIKVEPKPAKVEVKAIKVEAEASKAPAIESLPVKVEPKAPPEMPLLGISGGAGEKLPVSPPPIASESPTKVPIPLAGERPSLGSGTGDVGPLSAGMRRGVSKEKQVLPGPGGEGVAPKAAFHLKGDLGYEGEGGEGGEGVSAGRIAGPAGGRKILRSTEPEYPAWAEASGIEGRVDLKFWVLPSGEVSEVEVDKTSGRSEFDNLASQALREWRFERIEEKEKQWGIIPFIFEF